MKDTLMERACKLYFESIKSKQNQIQTAKIAGQKSPIKAAINKAHSLWERSDHKERVAVKIVTLRYDIPRARMARNR